MSSHDPVPSESGDGAATVDMLAAALRRDAADLEVYAQVLTGALADALPPGAVTVERKRGMADRLAGREGKAARLEVELGEQRLVLDLSGSRPGGEVCKEVRGVVLSRRPVELDEWVRELAEAVAARAASDARARAALERLLLGG
ncbi:hypothetical protein [Streptomyces noursei]|uniref:hypothetical protein n=1 Tax=Streptomyces noursei TaxID=1971 RepID=UPI0016758913|nr:hypothetical protein [Streptomyces noursei]MCZ1013162.1 hypothetical protein [Streptomyces noursei]GGX27391.1 hypothetical protein GCM10010341_56160 [Streptomyces noursei]